MCGISGYFSTRDMSKRLEKSLISIKHRGPDSDGRLTWVTNDDNFYVGLGHVRLSVLDLTSAGHQPMLSRDGRIAMVFNGEIYNYQELRKRLLGHAFSGRSDSEVLLEYYCRFGTKGLSDLRGMFSIVFYEIDSEKLVLVRDQIGIKPLYYSHNSEGFFFSSEIRGLCNFLDGSLRISRDALYDFLSCGFVYEPHTGFENILKVPAGSYAVIQKDGISLYQYFDLDKETQQCEYSEKLIERSIKGQLESDAKLGVFFSGGLDSTIIAAFANKPCLFAKYASDEVASSGGERDELYADEIAKLIELDLTKAPIGADQVDAYSVLESMRAASVGIEELISDYTYFASAELSKAARAEGFKVMLSGMGGDELFVGYPRYRLLLGDSFFRVFGSAAQLGWLRLLLGRIPSLAKKIDRFAQYYVEKEFTLRYARLLGYFRRDELLDLLGAAEYEKRTESFRIRTNNLLKGFESDPPVIRAMILDFYGFLSHNLTVADKSSMSVGLELRVPLLDKDLYCGYLRSLRSGSCTIKYGKKPLKRLLLSILPRGLVNRPKAGFNPPLDEKIRMIGEANILEVLGGGKIGLLLNMAAVNLLIHRHFSKVENNSYKIWQLLYLNFWINEHKVVL